MNTHRYLRAYMAGIVVPTVVLIFVLTGFILLRLVYHFPAPIERVIVFPMALVPNLFGLWNIFYLRLRSHPHLPIGLHGALLPFVLVPFGYLVGSSLNVITLASGGIVYFNEITLPYAHFLIGFTFALIAYYLVWKYFVGFFNQVLGIA
jgi:hypothetical protein